MLNDSNPMTNENTSPKSRALESDSFTDLLNRLGDSLTRMDVLMNAPPVVRLPIPPLKKVTVWPVSMPDVPDDANDVRALGRAFRQIAAIPGVTIRYHADKRIAVCSRCNHAAFAADVDQFGCCLNCAEATLGTRPIPFREVFISPREHADPPDEVSDILYDEQRDEDK